MELTPLSALSPLDGRYRAAILPLEGYFSEYALIAYRYRVELEYFLALCQAGVGRMAEVPQEVRSQLATWPDAFDETAARAVKAIERKTNHDVKALEYYIKQQLLELEFFKQEGKQALVEYVHFGLTSQDVNNTAIPMQLRDGLVQVYQPTLDDLIEQLSTLAAQWKTVPMLSRTHGQPASPTTLGKELYVFVERISRQYSQLTQLPFPAKFGGATGNFNAHLVAHPEVDWVAFANDFVDNTLGLQRSQTTTQIEHYDGLAAIFDNLRRINVVLIDLARDCWTYISLNYFRQRVVQGEVGSSAMPHKVNPIDFENAEGNLGLANALFDHLSNKLPVSRLQRDLTDSTVLRNLGVPIAHTLIALKALMRGLGKLELNQDVLDRDLEANWAILAEAIQTVLRREGYPKPYEALKALTRTGKPIDKEAIRTFIDSLAVSAEVKAQLHALTPQGYIGNA